MTHPLRITFAGLGLLAIALLMPAAVATSQDQAQAEPAAPDAQPVQDNREFRQAVSVAYRLLDSSQWERAELAFIEITRKFPDEGEGFYHLACCYSRWSKSVEGAAKDEKLELALANLRKCATATRPYEDLRNMARDTDMDPLRNSEVYPQVVATIRRRLVGPQQISDAEPLHYETFVPSGASGRMPVLVWCHETGGNPSDAVRQLRAFCQTRKWVLLAMRGPVELKEAADAEGNRTEHFGWANFAELRILRTLRNALRSRGIGLRLDAEQITVGGYRQGAHYALSAALVDPALIRSVLLVDSPVDTGTYPSDRVAAVAGKFRVFALHTTADTLGLNGAREAFAKFGDAGVSTKFVTRNTPNLMENFTAHVGEFDAWYRNGE